MYQLVETQDSRIAQYSFGKSISQYGMTVFSCNSARKGKKIFGKSSDDAEIILKKEFDVTLNLEDKPYTYDELIQLVKQSGAEKIYTIHGFIDEFAMDLNKLGFSAQPLRESSLDNFC